MNVSVSIKRAIDYNARIQIKGDGAGVVTNGVKHSIPLFDAIAVEHTMRWKETGDAEDVIAVTIGPDAAAEQPRTALAFGCDRASHVKTDAAPAQKIWRQSCCVGKNTLGAKTEVETLRVFCTERAARFKVGRYFKQWMNPDDRHRQGAKIQEAAAVARAPRNAPQGVCHVADMPDNKLHTP